jgi:pheromone a factor receptor
LTIYALAKREHQFSQVMSSNRNLNRGRYFRLMALAGVDVVCTIPLAAYVLSRNFQMHPGGWRSWTKTHNDGFYSHIIQIPSSIWKANTFEVFCLELPRWALVGCAFLFFAFFGFADEARQHYRSAFKSLATRAGFSTSSLTLGSSNAYVVYYVGLDPSSTSLQYFIFALHEEHG